jgi:hypothetical protein
LETGIKMAQEVTKKIEKSAKKTFHQSCLPSSHVELKKAFKSKRGAEKKKHWNIARILHPLSDLKMSVGVCNSTQSDEENVLLAQP